MLNGHAVVVTGGILENLWAGVGAMMWEKLTSAPKDLADAIDGFYKFFVLDDGLMRKILQNQS